MNGKIECLELHLLRTVTKTVLSKKNINNCREAYVLLREIYGGPLSVTEMAYIDNSLNQSNNK